MLKRAFGRRQDGSKDVLWLTPRGTEMTDRDWIFPEARYLAYVLGPPDGRGTPLFIVLNTAEQPIDFVLPAWSGCSRWSCILASVAISKQETDGKVQVGSHCEAPARSILVFEGEE